MSNIVKKITFSQKTGYLMSGLSYSICMLIPAFLAFYATESLAISITSVSLMMVFVKIFDGFTDIIAGFVIDKTKSKYGKARPWFIRVAIPYSISIVLLFSVPTNLGPNGKLILLAIFYALSVSVFGTIVGVARYALSSRMTNDFKEQGSLGVLGDGIGVVFMGTGMAVTMLMVPKIGWSLTFGIYAAITLIAAILTFVLTRENTEMINEYVDEKSTKKVVTLKDIVTTIITNKYALLAFIIVFIQQLAGGALAGSGTFYFMHVVGNINYFNMAMGLGTVLCFIGLFICTLITKKIGPKKMFVLGGILTAICYIGIITLGSLNIIITVVFLGFAILFGQTFLASNFAAFAGSAVVYGEKKNGVRADGTSSAVINIGIKLGTAFSTAIIGFVLGFGGYVEGGVQQNNNALESITFAFIYIPLISFVIATLIVIFFYRIEKDLSKLP